jgi:hypothetical protein
VERHPEAMTPAGSELTCTSRSEIARRGELWTCQGKLTVGLGDQILHDTIDELLGENWRKILLNLSEITFIDSAASASSCRVEDGQHRGCAA